MEYYRNNIHRSLNFFNGVYMVDLEKKFNELAEEYNRVVTALEFYETRVCPIYHVGEKIFVYKMNEKKVDNFKIDEIVINKSGVSYIEYINDKEFNIYPESFCFSNLIDLNKYVDSIKPEKK